MLEREILIKELWRRLSNVSTVNRTARNPASPPSIGDLPVIQFFELEDIVEGNTSRNGYPAYKRKLNLVIEAYTTATDEATSSKTLGEFVQLVKKELYRNGNNLNGTCVLIAETGSSRILRPPVADNAVGISLNFDVIYIENISRLY